MSTTSRIEPRAGFALLSVLLVLLALLALAAPFLWTASQADAAGARSADRATLRMALDDANRHARRELWSLHDEFDPTPDSDSLNELELSTEFAPDFYSNTAQDGARWDHAVSDLSGLVDLWSASPGLVANLMDRASYLTRPMGPEDEELRLASVGELPERGWLFVEGELIGYRSIEGSVLKGLLRGTGSDDSGCGPRRASDHPAGAPVIALESTMLALWRAGRDAVEAPSIDLIDVAAEIRELLPASNAVLLAPDRSGNRDRNGNTGGGVEQDLFAAMSAAFSAKATFQGGIASGLRWQRGVRVLGGLRAGESCTLQVREWRWANPGATVRIRSGDTSELGLVVSVGPGNIRLLDAVRNDYPEFETEFEVLAKRPININTAPRDVIEAAVRGLALQNRNERITRAEAEQLSGRIVDERPFDGHEDFLARIVLPSAGILKGTPGEHPIDTRLRAPTVESSAFLSTEDAIALYTNALNANDSELAFATAPFSFESRGTFEIVTRAAVERGGAARAELERRQSERVVPQVPLLALWDRQVDFDEALRLDVDAPGWATGPYPTSVFDARRNGSPPSRRRAHLTIDSGEDETADTPVANGRFALDDAFGYARPFVARSDDEGQRRGHVLHFDRSSSDLEGRDLGAEGALTYDPGDGLLDWLEGGLLDPFSLAFWAKLPAAGEGLLFDLASNAEGDRVSLDIESEALRLRVYDGPGDHPDTPFEEVAQVSLPLTSGAASELRDNWTHLELDVSGASPDLMNLRVDGMGLTRRDGDAKVQVRGQTALAAALGDGQTRIQVDSTEGFPERCVLRIGDELIEARKSSPTEFDASHALTGVEAGFGGRLAREQVSFLSGGGVQNQGLGKDASYSVGTPVMLHGYSAPLRSAVPSGSTQLSSELGPFAVGRVATFNGGEVGNQVTATATINGEVFSLVFGNGIIDEAPSSIELESFNPGSPSNEEVMAAFSTRGGFALVLQTIPGDVNGPNGPIEYEPDTQPIGGMHVMRYSGVDGTSLQVAEWQVTDATLPHIASITPSPLDPRSYIVEWVDGWTVDDIPIQERLDREIFVVPISVALDGTANALLEPPVGTSELAQLTEADSAELTEWVRYDTLLDSHIVRDSAVVLERVYLMATKDPTGLGFTGPGGPQPGGGTSEPGGGSNSIATPPKAPTIANFANSTATQDIGYWTPVIGSDPGESWPVSRAIRTALDMRGVFGTHSQEHAAGTPVMPVFRLRGLGGINAAGAENPQWGWPGRFDPIYAVDVLPNDPGFSALVHRGYRPTNRRVFDWTPGPSEASNPSEGTPVPEDELPGASYYVALDRALGVPLAPGSTSQFDGGDARHYARLMKFPSGELPRFVDRLAFNSSFDGEGASGLGFVLDEVTFLQTNFSEQFRLESGDSDAAFVLGVSVDTEDQQFLVLPATARLSIGDVAVPPGVDVLDALPEDAGLLQIGAELIVYESRDPTTGTLNIAANGRGVLGTEAQPHMRGETLRFIYAQEVSKLVQGAAAGDSEFALDDAQGFPNQGTVLIGDELAHFTWKSGDQLGMPRRSSIPGRGDFKGPGAFRGRFGTPAGAHADGAIVMRFPFRYWDRFEPQTDVAELHYFGFDLTEPEAFVEGCFFEREEPSSGAVRLGVLQRADPSIPWDADPEGTEGLSLLYQADPSDGPAEFGRTTDQAEWRVFAEYLPGAFDADGALLPGWKQAPNLGQFGVSYFAPGRVLSRSQR